ncbi:MAG: HpsJ family protein [Thermosynechococcaceae cyanobacterium MS004]|nr:HpsJ family protein [Thermosynechococcaceae cyanobacterium MS004]
MNANTNDSPNIIDSRPLRQTSLVLPWVGIILILTFVFDFAVRLFGLDFSKPDILLNLLNEFIDRGVIALIGLAFISAGFWLNKAINRPITPAAPAASPLGNPQFWTFVFASLLGLLFLLLVPIHFSTSGQIVNAAITRADQQEAQMKFGIQQEQEQIQQVLASGQLDQLLQQKNLQPEQLALLQEIKKDPKALDKRAAQRLSEMQTQKQQAIDQVSKEVSVNRWRAEVRSLLLALGFIAVGWTGLREAS